jgi:Rps23 Pro-64 3,4-dihydroxylase Tpa1-like proline 4-hydroxylase
MESLLKEELFEKGYIVFNLKDFDTAMYNTLVEDFPLNELIPEKFTNLRNSIIELKKPKPYDANIINTPFNKLEIIKKDILQNYTDGIDYSLDQIWYWKPPNILNKNFDKILKPLLQYFYDYDMKECQSDITMYNDGCYLLNHKDAQSEITKRKGHCVILIYLSTDYEKGKGGELIIDNDLEVEPIFGNVAIMDFTKHNPEHAVRKVNGYNRFCYINFC